MAAGSGATVERAPPARADRAAMERILAQYEVERVPVPPESSYLGELYRAGQQAVLGALRRGSELLNLPRPVVLVLASALVGAAILLLLRTLLPLLRRAPARPEQGSVAAFALPHAARDAAAWRAELERCLSEGRITEALEALWWWLARSVAGSEAEPDWTGRDLVRRSRRDDLRVFVSRLDAFTYGPRRPAVEELRALAGRLEESLP